MRRIKRIAAGVLLMLLLVPTVVQADEMEPETLDERSIKSNDGAAFIGSADLPTVSYGSPAVIKLPLVNGEDYDITNVRVTLKKNKDVNDYPFKSTTTNHFAEADKIKAGKQKAFKFTVDVHDSAKTQNYNLDFEIRYTMRYNTNKERITETVNFTQPIVISVNGNPENEAQGGGEGGGEGDESPEPDGGTDTSTGWDSDPVSTPSSDEGEEEKGKTSTPRVIIEGFTTSPASVSAGDTFSLKLRVKNTSKKTAVSNMVITLQAPQAGGDDDTSAAAATSTAAEAFLPVSGSTTLYIDSIGKDSVKEVSIDLTARADLVQKPYAIEADMKYEGEGAEAYESTASISVPVKQAARFDLSQVEILPDVISVGEEANVNFNIYNMGRTKLYNVWARLESSTLSGAEAFVGNIEAGATGAVDIMAMGAEETADDGTVKIVITYEDQDGNQGIFDSTCTLFVMPAEDIEASGMADWEEMEQESSDKTNKGLIAGIIIGVVVIIGIIVTVVIVKKKHKKTEDFADEFFGSDQDE